MLGEQFRNVSIVPQVITVMRAEAQTPWPGEETAWTHWKKAKTTVESCRWNWELLQTQIRQTKNLRSTNWDYLCMQERKKGKSSHKNWSECSCVLWWWNRSDTWARTACSGLRLSSLPSALQSTGHTGMCCLFGLSHSELGFQSDLVLVFISWLSLSPVFFKKQQGSFPQGLHAMAELSPLRNSNGARHLPKVKQVH